MTAPLTGLVMREPDSGCGHNPAEKGGLEMKIKQAWYLKQVPTHIVAELTDGRLVMFRLTPFRKVGEDELVPYQGYHPSKCASWVVPQYVLKHYGCS